MFYTSAIKLITLTKKTASDQVQLTQLIVSLFNDDTDKCTKVLSAINAATGFSLLTMQQSYQEASIAEELEKILKISGISRTLFSNLADAYKD